MKHTQLILALLIAGALMMPSAAGRAAAPRQASDGPGYPAFNYNPKLATAPKAAQYGLPPTAVQIGVSQPLAPGPAADSAPEPGGNRWPWVALGLLALLLAGAAIWETRRRRAIWQRRLARRYELRQHSQSVAEARQMSKAPLSKAPPQMPREDDDELLRRLLSD